MLQDNLLRPKLLPQAGLEPTLPTCGQDFSSLHTLSALLIRATSATYSLQMAYQHFPWNGDVACDQASFCCYPARRVEGTGISPSQCESSHRKKTYCSFVDHAQAKNIGMHLILHFARMLVVTMNETVER